MASDKQIAANRRNAQKSTGPRSASGKKRASKNAFRHGLSRPMLGPAIPGAVDELARRIAPDTADQTRLEIARDAAEAMLELARARRLKVALIDSAARLDRLDLQTAWLIRHSGGAARRKGRPKMAVGYVSSQPIRVPQRTAEAGRRTLPALLRLQRYEARAAVKRDHAIRELAVYEYLSRTTTTTTD